MCGIVGLWNRSGPRPSLEHLQQMMATVAHRGPEGSGFARLDENRLLFGFLLLGFTGAGTAHQPMFNEDYSIALVFNGEIYDFEKLRADLIQKGHSFRTASDSEVIIHLYETYGEEFHRHLNGEFSFVLWDARKGKLLCARDPFGVKPLYYTRTGSGFAFASECKALLSLPQVSRELNPLYWRGPGVGLADNRVTPFQGIHSVRPGHYLHVYPDRVVEEPYFVPNFSKTEVTYEQAVAQVREALHRAVARRLEGDPPIALSLSSGIDSTILCGVMSSLERERGRKVQAFSLGYPGAGYDESAIAEQTARRFSADFHRIDYPQTQFADDLLDGLYAVEVGTNSLSTTARIGLTKAVQRSGLKAIMSGEGSDELFGGYPYFGADHLWSLLKDQSWHERARSRLWREFAATESKSRGMFWNGSPWRLPPATLYGYPSEYQARIQRVGKIRNVLFSTDHLTATAHYDPLQAALEELPPVNLESLSPFDVTRCISRSVLGSLVIPSLGDRVEMAASLEGRVPYLDQELVRLAYSFDGTWCVSGGGTVRKKILRDAFGDLLADHPKAPPKHTLMAPAFSTLRSTERGRMLVEHLLSPGLTKEANLFSPLFVRGLKRLWERVPAHHPRHASLDLTIAFIATNHGLFWAHVGGGVRHVNVSGQSFLENDRTPGVAV